MFLPEVPSRLLSISPSENIHCCGSPAPVCCCLVRFPLPFFLPLPPPFPPHLMPFKGIYVAIKDFLQCAFAVESNTAKKACLAENGSECSTPELQVTNNNLRVHNETPDKVSESTSKNDDFVNLWNSKNDDLFFSRSPTKRMNPRNLLDVARAESPMGFKSEVVTRVAKNVISRKFPGPAGLLPERTSNTSFIAAEEYISKLESDNSTISNFEDKQILSQATNNIFEEPGGAWRTMMEELGSRGTHLVSTINLATIRVKQARFGFKVPFLAVCVHNIDCSLPDPSLLLKDQKDEMHGTLHREVWEDWKGEIVVGSVLVLRNTGVVTAGMSSRRYFLNITANNITIIYTPKHDNNLKVTQIQSVSGLDTSQILDEWEKVISQTRQQQQSTEHQARPLFSSFSPGPQSIPSPSLTPLGSSTFPSPLRSASPSPIQRPFSSPMRPVFRPKVPIQPQRRPLGCHNTPRQQYTNNNRIPLQRMPLHSSPSPYNNPLKNNFKAQENLTPQQGSGSKSNNPSFKLKTEVFKTKINSTPSQSISKNPISVPVPGSVGREELASAPAKKPKQSSENNPFSSTTSTSSVFSLPSANTSSIVDSVLDGIDTDLFFDDF